MPRGSSFSSVLTFFREGNEDEVRAILPLVIEAAGARHITIHAGAAPRPARPAKRGFNRTSAAKKAWATRRLNAANTGSDTAAHGAAA